MASYRYISQAEMDRITSTILVKKNLMPTIDKISRVNIDYLIEFEYDLYIAWKDLDYLSDDDNEVLAAIHPQSKMILMNETKKNLFEEKIGTMNFSKAHELGHWVLHVTEEKNDEQLFFTDNDKFYCRSRFKNNPIEIQANMFAASLLMPKKLIQDYINNLKSYKHLSFADLYDFKDKLEVSISALVRRIKDLELLHITTDGEIYHCIDEMSGQLKIF